MQFEELAEFKKEFKKLKKKYKSLDKDLEILKSAIKAVPKGNGSRHWNILHNSDGIVICKVRMQCAYLKKKSFRVIYAYNYVTEKIEFVEFIEIYFKGNKVSEDKCRIKKYTQRQ